MTNLLFTFASPVIGQLVSLVTVAVVSNWSVDAPLSTSAIVLRAFIFSASVLRLVFKIGTVWLLITYFGERNAHALAAVELGTLVANGLRSCCKVITVQATFVFLVSFSVTKRKQLNTYINHIRYSYLVRNF